MSDPKTDDTTIPGRAAPSPAVADRLPDIPGYHLLGVLGRGGMSVVYKAQQLQPARIVALKMILRGEHATPEQRLRFLHEAEAVAALHHPNIVDVYAVGHHDGVPYFTLEYVPGGSLADRVEDGPLPPRLAAEVLEPVARAVAAAHRAGFVHRDLKPDNILLAGGEVTGWRGGDTSLSSTTSPLHHPATPKVTDFGLAKRLALDSGLTQTGAIFGTPSYMAPEQAEDAKVVGPAADVWGLGATLYRVVTGRPPFLGATAMDTLYQVIARDPVPPGELVPDVPRDLETICLKCLEKAPTRRYADADALADDLRRFLSGQTIRARPVGPVERGVKWVRRNPVVAALLALVFLSLAVGTAVSAAFAFAAARDREAARLSARGESEKAEDARRAEERTRDVLCRSLFEQARGLRQSRAPGRSWRALELLAEATALRARPRGDSPLPNDLPTVADLRSEAVSAAALTDLRMAGEWSVIGPTFPSGDGRLVAINSPRPDNPAMSQRRILDLATGTELGRVDLTDDTAGPWVLDRRGTRAAVIAPSFRRGVAVLELPYGTPLFDLPWPKDPGRGLVVTPWDMQLAVHGDRLAAAKLDEECDWLVIWDLTRPKELVRTFRFPHEPAQVRTRSQPVLFSPDGRHAAVGLFDRRVAVVRADGSGEPLLVKLPNPDRVALRDWLPERPWWLLVDRPAGGAAVPFVWDYSAGKEVYRLPPCEPDALVGVADPTRIAVGTPVGSVRLFDAASGRELGETPALHSRQLTHFLPLPDGRVSTASDDGTLRLWG
ncbi:MAG TPA: WD40 repeat domain-containing serine/threonine protein kinase, partial [Fimbriiglobus sp.]|nr:WD40 repeat domain-containing serine/threonine protein kinase [Fimbriiglobus sp.]